MKSKYKTVLFSLLAFGGNVRYMSLLHFPQNFYCVFLIFWPSYLLHLLYFCLSQAFLQVYSRL